MDKSLVSISPESLAKIPFDRLEGDALAAAFTSISQATHGDLDVSMYEGFDLILARYGEEETGSVLRPRFAALLRRRSDGAIRMIRHWAHDGFMEGDVMVAHDDRWTIEAAFSTHGVMDRIAVSSLCHAYEWTPATAADVRAHDAAALREIAWHARRIARRTMNANLARTLDDTAVDLTPERDGPLTVPASRPSWLADWGSVAWYAGYTPTLGKHHALNWHHLKALAERLDAAGDGEAASTLRWLGWHRDLDNNRDRFLADEAVQVLHGRVALLEQALASIELLDRQVHHVVDSTMRSLPTECLSHYCVERIVKEALEESQGMAAVYDAYSGKRDRRKSAEDASVASEV